MASRIVISRRKNEQNEAAQGMKNILVTGGNAGIGLALCRTLLVDHGCTVLLGSRDYGRGEAALAGLGLDAEAAGRCTVVPLDVSDDGSVAMALELVRTALEGAPLHALVNNAGIGFSEASAEAVLNTNLYGAKWVTEAMLPLLGQSEETGARVVNLGSGAAGGYVAQLGETDAARDMCRDDVTWRELEAHIAAQLEAGEGGPALSNGGYGLSKAALAQYTKICAREHPNITFSCCSPGFINTRMTAGFGASKEPDEATPVLLQMLFAPLDGNGWYYGSDGVRSPYHFMRNPGEPPYDGKMPF